MEREMMDKAQMERKEMMSEMEEWKNKLASSET